MGLVIFGVMALYLVASIAIVVSAARTAKKKGRSPWRWGGAAALIMYLLVFWDHIPTVLAHKYYCEKEGGFWVHKTVKQWKLENPGVAETLVANREGPSTRQGDMENYTDTYFLNQRLNWVARKTGPLLFNRWRWEKAVIDTKTNEVLAQYVDFPQGADFSVVRRGHSGLVAERSLCRWGEQHVFHGCPRRNMSQLLKGDQK